MVAASMVGISIAAVVQMSKLRDRPPRRFLPTVIGAPDSDAVPIFAARERRRAVVALIADAGSSSGNGWLVSGATAGVRFGRLFDLQLGFRHAFRRGAKSPMAIALNGDPPEVASRDGTFVVARFGFHIPIDAHHRVAIPMSVDVGGGTGSYFRANLGLRYRLSDRLYLGAYPFNPTRIRVSNEQTNGTAVWTWQSGLELGLSY